MTIWILLLAVVIGLIAGVVRGGDFRTILSARIYHPEFLASSIVCAFVVSATDIDSGGVIAFVALLGAFAFTLVNLHLVGMVVISVGLALNLFVFILNFATPVRPNALVEAEIVTAEGLERGVRSMPGHMELADNDSVLDFLGDTFPIRLGGNVVSIGDLIFLVGLANVTGNLMLGNQRRRYAYDQFWQADESAGTALGGEAAEIPIELDLETPEPAGVHSEPTTEYSGQATAYFVDQATEYSESETGYGGAAGEHPDPTTVYLDAAGEHPDPATGYPDPTTVYPGAAGQYPDPATGYPGAAGEYSDSEPGYSAPATVYPESYDEYSESPTVYPQSYDEYSESPTVYPQSVPTVPQPQQSEEPDEPDEPEEPDETKNPEDPWSEPPWNPTT
ncbi:MAG: DUF5317 family protein [Acidimicrobiaceae bacterium]|nr:DUF5317 family protein [Acidimicrobiaceae bacterium]